MGTRSAVYQDDLAGLRVDGGRAGDGIAAVRKSCFTRRDAQSCRRSAATVERRHRCPCGLVVDDEDSVLR
jgi:hypothetical protein